MTLEVLTAIILACQTGGTHHSFQVNCQKGLIRCIQSKSSPNEIQNLKDCLLER